MQLKFHLPPETRIDVGISREYPDLFSRSHVQKIIHEGRVLADGEACLKPSHKFRRECEILIDYEPPREYSLHANSEISVPIIFQDRHIAIIHKPAGMTVHPGAGTGEDTLVHVLLSQMDHLSDGSDELRPGIVHRLDRETEGLMIIAKDNHTHFALSQLFVDRKILKQYYAVVWGHTGDSETIEGFIGRHTSNRKKMMFSDSKINDSYREASMSYRTISRTSLFSLLDITLHTGRTHQIRASLSYIDHPVLGDQLYSRFPRRLEKTDLSSEEKEKITLGGLYLMAYKISFVHPASDETMVFELPVPERFRNLFPV